MLAKRLTATVDPDSITDNTLSAYATVEVVDLEGDIVRVAGCDLSLHDIEPIKIFPDHTYYNEASGEPTVIGRVKSLEKTAWKDGKTPAIKFTLEWANTDLAKSYRDLYKDGFLSGFSAGLLPLDGKEIKTGVEWTETRLTEISCASIPANQYANVIKAFKAHNIPLRRKNMSTPQTLDPTGVAGQGFTRKDFEDGMGMHMSKATKDMGDMMGMHAKSVCDHVDKCMKEMHERLDGIEAGMAVAQDGPTAQYKSLDVLAEIEAKKSADAVRAALEKAIAEIGK